MTPEIQIEKESPFACVMGAIEPAKRGQHLATIRQVFGAVTSIRELPDGYAFELPNQSETLLKATEFITLERLCCPFSGFILEVEREGGPLWLQLTGREGVKPFIHGEIGGFLNESVASAANFPKLPE